MTDAVGNGRIEIFGSLVILGNSNNPVKISNLEIYSKEVASQISINHLEASNLSIFAEPGSLQLRNSLLSSSQVYVRYVPNESFIEGNVFQGSSFSTRQSGAGNPAIYLRNNVFVADDLGGRAIGYMNTSYGPSDSFVVKYNSFLGYTLQNLYYHPSNYPQPIDLSENFWGTTDTSVIDTMIFDRNDDLNIPIFVTYLPILTTPDPDTPAEF